MNRTELPSCPFCGAEGEKTHESSSSSFRFSHKKINDSCCFLSAYVVIQDYQIEAWCRRSGKSVTVKPGGELEYD